MDYSKIPHDIWASHILSFIEREDYPTILTTCRSFHDALLVNDEFRVLQLRRNYVVNKELKPLPTITFLRSKHGESFCRKYLVDRESQYSNRNVLKFWKQSDDVSADILTEMCKYFGWNLKDVFAKPDLYTPEFLNVAKDCRRIFDIMRGKEWTIEEQEELRVLTDLRTDYLSTVKDGFESIGYFVSDLFTHPIPLQVGVREFLAPADQIEFISNSKACMQAAVTYESRLCWYCSKSLRQSEPSILLESFKRNPKAIVEISRPEKAMFVENHDFVWKLVEFNEAALIHVFIVSSQKLRLDPSFWKEAIRRNYKCFKYLSQDHPHFYEIALSAVTSNGRTLKELPVTLRKDKEIVKAALKSYYGAIHYADPSLLDDPELKPLYL